MGFREFLEAIGDGDYGNMYSLSLYQSAPKTNDDEFAAKGVRSKYVVTNGLTREKPRKPEKIFGFKKKV